MKPAPMPLVLVVDDEPSVIFLVEELLDEERVVGAADAKSMARAIAAERPDLVLLDVNLPDGDGFEIAARLSADPGAPPFVFLTAQAAGEDAAAGLRLGAQDYIKKPFAGAELVARVRAALARGESLRRSTRASSPPAPPRGRAAQAAASGRTLVDPERRRAVFGRIVGRSEAIEGAIALVDRAAGIDATLFLSGESGTGKELFARAFHAATGRGSGPFVAVNCAAIPRELAEGLFFGHAKGSFTGAQADRAGYFEEARGGTLFLDEIGELPQELQGALLRAVESRRIRRLGESGERNLDLRLVAATNRDLLGAVRRGGFRADLYYRLEEIPVRIPSLAERREDIPLLIRSFLEEFAALSPHGPIELGEAAMRELAGRDWPGNVRELKNLVRRVVISARAPLVESLAEAFGAAAPSSPGALGAPTSPHATGRTETLRAMEREAIEKALQDSGGDVASAAAALGISRATLYRRISGYARRSGQGA